MPGYREDTYQRDLQVQFGAAGLSYEPQKLFEVHDSLDSGSLIGYYIPDFVVENHVIVDTKTLNGLVNSHIGQVIGYLAVSGLSVGLLINFGQCSLQDKRILPPLKIQEHHINRQWLFVPDWLKPDP